MSKILSGFGFALRTFSVKSSEFSIVRSWSRDPAYGSDSAETRDFIIGKATSDKDDVCVIGTERHTKKFSLAICSDKNAKEQWEWIKANDVLIDESNDTPERRIKKRICELLDESPPTATLFTIDADWETKTEAGWGLECQIPHVVLQQLMADAVAERVDTITIGIKWAAGLVKDEHAPLNIPTTWGLLTLPGNESPEALSGHVSFFSWQISTNNNRKLKDQRNPPLPQAG